MAQFTVRNELGAVVASDQSMSINNDHNGAVQQLKLSEGYYSLYLGSLAAGKYVLSVTHPEQETQYLRFQR